MNENCDSKTRLRLKLYWLFCRISYFSGWRRDYIARRCSSTLQNSRSTRTSSRNGCVLSLGKPPALWIT